MAELERRAGILKGIEVRQDTDDGPVITGYAAVFNQASVDLGGFTEVIRPGAFANVLDRGDDIVALWNHDVNYVLGRVSNGTLVLYEDELGLRYEVRPRRVVGLTISLDLFHAMCSNFSFYVAENGEMDKAPMMAISGDYPVLRCNVSYMPAYQTVVVAALLWIKPDSLRAGPAQYHELHCGRRAGELKLRAKNRYRRAGKMSRFRTIAVDLQNQYRRPGRRAIKARPTEKRDRCVEISSWAGRPRQHGQIDHLSSYG